MRVRAPSSTRCPHMAALPVHRLSSFASRVLDAHPVCTVPLVSHDVREATTIPPFCFPNARKHRELSIVRGNTRGALHNYQPEAFHPSSCTQTVTGPLFRGFLQTRRRSSARSKVVGSFAPLRNRGAVPLPRGRTDVTLLVFQTYLNASEGSFHEMFVVAMRL